MKLALINPGTCRSLKKENLGLAYLAACVDAIGWQTRIIDEVAGQDVETALDEFKPDVVGISFMTMHALRAYELADRIRQKRQLPVILGGAHPTALPDEAIQHADCVLRGEGEITLPEILKSGHWHGIIDGRAPHELDALPLPKRSLLDLDFYARSGEEVAGLSLRTLGLITSRGCPYHCDFCINSRREVPLRFHSPDRVIEEIAYLAERYNIQSVAFYDELMATDPVRFRTICEKMIERRLNHLRWECQAHPRTVRRDLLPLMKEAGCIQVAIGFESGSQAILDRISKNTLVEKNLETARLVKEYGLRLRGCFIIGIPGETREDIQKTEAFIKKARIDFASIHFLTPFPGTALNEQMSERLKTHQTSWDKFTTGDPDAFVCNETIPAAEQKRLYEDLCARQAFRNYSLWEMAKRALKNPQHALHIAAKLLRR